MKTTVSRLFLFGLLITFSSLAAAAQSFVADRSVSPPSASSTPADPAAEIEEVKRRLAEQGEEIKQLREMVLQQARLIDTLQQTGGRAETAQSPAPAAAPPPPAAQTAAVEDRLTKVEEQAKRTQTAIEKNQLGTLGFSGDLRMQYDSLYGLLNTAPNVTDPAVLGNELSSRQRVRFRLRFAVTGKLGRDVFTGAYAGGEKRLDKEFEWGFRLSSGSLPNPVSPNPVLTDFFSRKPIALDRAYVAWRPRPLPGLRVIAGKFEPNWTRTEMTIDNDLQVEGVGQTFSRDIKNSFLTNLTLSAWQLPLLERGTNFIKNADGTVNIAESRRSGRDLALFGAQLQTSFRLSPLTDLTVSAANLHFANTASINAVQVFGNNLQLPVTVTIPATATAPSQTVTGVATIARELLVSGNANLGLASATNAAVNRDGRLASGFNLVDLIARLDFKQFRHAPVTIIFDYVRNTQTRDVIVAGPAGENVFLPNEENAGVWAEFRVQNLRRTRKADFGQPVSGDMLFSYTFLQIEKDAVLTPFNWDDLVQPSDIRAHRLFFSYTVDPRVTLNITGLFNRRLNGLLGPFRTTPPGSLDRDTVRLQFDTVFRF